SSSSISSSSSSVSCRSASITARKASLSPVSILVILFPRLSASALGSKFPVTFDRDMTKGTGCRCRPGQAKREPDDQWDGVLASQNHFHRLREPILLIRCRHMCREPLDLVGRVAHGERYAAARKHRQVVLHVADGRYGFRGNAKTRLDGGHERPLV